MNAVEFLNWQGFHAARFPLWGSFLRNLPKDACEGQATQGDVLAAMAETLADVSLADAKEATRRLARGDEFDVDKFDQHPKVVRAIARRISSDRLKVTLQGRKPPREPRFTCKMCWDEGVVTVWHPETVRDCRTLEGCEAILASKKTAYTCVVACGACQLGADKVTHGYRRFDDRMLVVPDGLNRQQRLQELVEFANRADRNAWTGLGD